MKQMMDGRSGCVCRGVKFSLLLYGLLGVMMAGDSLRAQELRPWTEYRTVLWMGEKGQKNLENPKLPERLRELGMNTGMVSPGEKTDFYEANGFGFYIENTVNEGLCLKFRSNVTNWGKFINEWMESRDPGALVRAQPLEDEAWLGRMSERVAKTARGHAAAQPLMHDLRDELSTTISANPFDYDFSETSLKAFREWLKTQYADLAALNRQWETSFTTWDEVRPFTTDQMKQRMASGLPGPEEPKDWAAVRAVKFNPATAREERTRWNFAPWADHRTYMDVALARALETFRQAARAADPATPAGVEGTQMPHAFGGYDLWRLAQVMDWVEPYDICNSREILGSFMPDKPILATVFETETLAAQRRLWHLLLEGDKGCIVWWSEDVIDWSQPDLPLTAKGRALAPVMKSLTTPLAQLFLRAERERDPIAIHYSQASVQVAWMLETLADGKTWVKRFSSYEADHNRHAVMRNAWLKVFQDYGFSPVFVSSEEIENGALEKRGIRVLALPGSRAMSDAEVAAVTAFSARGRGNMLCGQGLAGFFDEHGTVRDEVPKVLADFAEPGDLGLVVSDTNGSWSRSKHDFSRYTNERLNSKGDSPLPNTYTLDGLSKMLKLKAPVSVPVEERVRVHRYRVGTQARLVAFERNIEYKMREELAQAGGNEALEKETEFTATLEEPGHVVNLRTGEQIGLTKSFTVKLDPWQPALFAILPEAAEGDVVEKLLKTF